MKLHEQNQALKANQAELVKVVGDAQPDQIPVMLAEGKLPGKVILAEAVHQELVNASETLAEIQKAEGGEPTVVLGKVVLTEAKFNELNSKVETASQQLSEMRVEKFLNDNSDRYAPAERERLSTRLSADFENVSADILARPKISGDLFTSLGGDNPETEPDSGASKVAEFVGKREGEILASDPSMEGHKAYSLALAEARNKFSKEEMQAFEYPQSATV